MRSMRLVSALLGLMFICSTDAFAADMLTNGSFENDLTSWVKDPTLDVQVRQSPWNGVSAVDGSKLLAVSGPAQVGCTYARLVTQSLSAPFGTGIPNDNFMVYLYAATYLHTNDGRAVSYALTIEPGYGAMVASFHGGAQNEWVTAQSWGYYYAKDPYDPAAPAKPLVIVLELRDSLQAGEYLLLDAASLYYGGNGY